MYKLLLILSLSLFSCSTLKQSPQLQSSQLKYREFAEIISSGDVAFTANGGNGIWGKSITGSLKNNTSSEIYINAVLRGGLYLRNSGKGQNMLAILILPEDLKCTEDGGNKYFCLSRKSNTKIVFIAFCANAERDSPSSSETFDIGSMPSSIVTISKEISEYMSDKFMKFLEANFDYELVSHIGSALWYFQRGNIFKKDFRSYIEERYRNSLEDYRQQVKLLENFI
jgi:hypothetical protein